MKTRSGVGAAAIVMLAALPATAQDFYQNKTIRVIVSSAPGGSYDAHARLLTRHMGRHIAGHPGFMVQNLPAARGLAAANQVFNVMDKDGTVIGFINRYMVLASITGNEQARFKAEEFSWLGTTASFSDNPYMVIIKASLPQKSIGDLRVAKPQINAGTSGSAAIIIMNEALKLNLKVIEGYERNQLDLAFERGEVDGLGIAYANIQARHSDWISKKLVRAMIQFGRSDRHADFRDVPTARELATTPEDLALIELAEAPLLMAYPLAFAPGVPEARVADIRKAFSATVADPAYMEEIAKLKLEYSPKSGEELQSLVASIAKAPASAIERYRKIVGSRGGE
jgi:tripartite-type tricarboxylate transporter receptor subunit TctC